MQRAQNARVRQGHGNYLPPGQLQQQQQSFHHQQQQHQHEAAPPAHHVAAPAAALPPGAPAHLTSTTFASLPLSPASQRALHEVLGFTNLTQVQDATMPAVSASAASSNTLHTRRCGRRSNRCTPLRVALPAAL